MTTLKLNYRHSIKSMNAQLKKHNEVVSCFGENGKIVHSVRKIGRRGYSKKHYFYSAKDCTDYINAKNGV